MNRPPILRFILPCLVLAGCASFQAPMTPESPEGKVSGERAALYEKYKLQSVGADAKQGWMRGNERIKLRELEPLFAQSSTQAAFYYTQAKRSKASFDIMLYSNLGLGSASFLSLGFAPTFAGLGIIGTWVLDALMIIESFEQKKMLRTAVAFYNEELLARYSKEDPQPEPAAAAAPGPMITIASPPIQRGLSVVSTDKTLLVEGTAASTAGVFEVTVNGIEAKLGSKGDFSAEVRLAVGENEIVVAATDVKGARSMQAFRVNRDVEASAAQASAQAAPGIHAARRGKDFALLFATDTYGDWQELVNPVSDAEAIAKELRDSYGFEVDVVIDATQERVLTKLYDYANRRYQSDDQLFVFFAGHGQFDDVTKMGYEVAADSARASADLVRKTYISHSEIRDRLDAIPCSHVLLAMDVCFGGTFDRAMALRGNGDDPYGTVSKSEFIQRKMEFRTRKYITSGGKTYVPDGRPGQHSPFAARFLEALRSYGGLDGVLTYGEVIAAVEGATPQPMAGDFGSNEPGSDFVFIAE